MSEPDGSDMSPILGPWAGALHLEISKNKRVK
jgi:hypothetical protein